jgi:hypothetical protein
MPDAQGFANALAQRIVEFALLTPRDSNLPVQLLYIMQSGPGSGGGYFAWAAGLPIAEAPTADPPRDKLPASYRTFTQVHNGFLLEGWGSAGPTSVEELFHLDTLPIPGADELGYEPHDLLAFSGDGAGNEQCYLLTQPTADGDYATVDWDHETRGLGPPGPFWKYVEELVTKTYSH